MKDLQERAGQASSLQEVKASDIEVQAVEVEPGEPIERITKKPTPMPTPQPTFLKEDNTTQILTICIVITSGLIVLLGAFILFRRGQRRAAKKQREKMEKKARQRELARRERHMEGQWDDFNKSRQAGGREPHGEKMTSGYPPPPNYYPSRAHNHDDGYGGPPPPGPPYGHSYGGQYSQSYPYPPPPTKSSTRDRRNK